MPRSKIAESDRWAPGSYTLRGPPERMIPFGERRRISSAEMEAGKISERTRHSRTRRAMSWGYWAPQTTTRTVSNAGAEGDGGGMARAGSGFGDVAAGAHPAVGDALQVATRLVEVAHPGRRHIRDGRRLGHPDPEHLPGGAGGAGADPDEDAHGSGPHEVQRGG